VASFLGAAGQFGDRVQRVFAARGDVHRVREDRPEGRRRSRGCGACSSQTFSITRRTTVPAPDRRAVRGRRSSRRAGRGELQNGGARGCCRWRQAVAGSPEDGTPGEVFRPDRCSSPRYEPTAAGQRPHAAGGLRRYGCRTGWAHPLDQAGSPAWVVAFLPRCAAIPFTASGLASRRRPSGALRRSAQPTGANWLPVARRPRWARGRLE